MFARVCGVLLFGLLGCSATPAERLGIDHSPNTGLAGFCRTTTCAPPQEYPTDDGLCEPPGWSDSQTCRNKKASNAPVWWRTACVGYDLDVGASRAVAYEAFRDAVEGAFLAWTTASCPSEGKGSSRASIDVRDLGPVDCHVATYDKSGGPNQNVILFHDDVWPYEERDRKASHTLTSTVIALTTVTFNPQTGEIYDADMELNTADFTIVPLDTSPPPTTPDTYDLRTIVTHEAGHFLGLAHSPDDDAVMYRGGDSSGSTRKRQLTSGDVRGICAIYPPDATRNVSTLVDSSGKLASGACDPTPRHGHATSCGSN